MSLDPRQDDSTTLALLNKIDALENHADTTHAIQALVVETSKQSVILGMIQKSLDKAESAFIAANLVISERLEKLESERIRPLEEFKSNLEGQMKKIGLQGGAVGAGGMSILVGIYHLVKDYLPVNSLSGK